MESGSLPVASLQYSGLCASVAHTPLTTSLPLPIPPVGLGSSIGQIQGEIWAPSSEAGPLGWLGHGQNTPLGLSSHSKSDSTFREVSDAQNYSVPSKLEDQRVFRLEGLVFKNHVFQGHPS
ncbi:hypothetical protein FGO68_gene10100 [Halteria grandinella]|uniref:Uncharacterized protein n=1 Tax=Halteria grandinella TaxID=5974 RepID=A0A8J8N9Q8_HALGN|nr:hypothetical protein FGO68_gene10100 [Halteria grandinella]